TKKWLDDYDRLYDTTYQAWHDSVEEKVAGLTDPMKIIPLAHSYVYRYPSGRLISREDVAASDTDTCIYVVMRQAGECNDRRLEKGDYYLTDTERENLTLCAGAYRHTILVINVGGHIDLGFLDEIEGIDAVVIFAQGGEEGGSALADVLSGKVDFSGRLADTLPLKYADIPFGGSFSYLDGNTKREAYREGIYVGYRYYDTFSVPVRYPFGYGLSYGSYPIHTEGAKVRGEEVTISVTVSNEGEFSGQQVVEAYLMMPQTELPSEKKRLVAFAKTKVLKKGEKEALSLSFMAQDMTVYDPAQSAWLLQKGNYVILVGEDMKRAKPVAAIRVSSDHILQQCRPCGLGQDGTMEKISELPAPALNPTEIPAGISVLSFDESCLSCIQTRYLEEPGLEETQTEQEVLRELSPQELLQLTLGGDLQSSAPEIFNIPGAAGKTTTALILRPLRALGGKGLPNVLLADGPAGLNVMNRSHALPDGTFSAVDVPERYRWGILGKMVAKQLAATPGPIVYRYATAWPVEMLLAQTWNTSLLQEIGDAVGAEMEAFGISVWLAPGMNIHRNPLGGRTFEYYSEDPVLSGEMAAALTRGVQRHPGRSVAIKHFCCNNSEDNRNGINEVVGERALREIYLKGFEIAVRKGHPGTLMSSYNMLNGVYTANRKDLLTDVLRCEWGFDGIVMSDWG
ncbi:MAG: glycoside hydrolase family 3 N-terminal domain-containing protein, partial [Lachnospiraceae bacterium]